ncbi:MAG: GGDEF domain-containing response regulator, partial [Gemmatimonadaceae bacterium]
LLIEDNEDHARAIEILSARLDLFPFNLLRAETLAIALGVLRCEQPRLILLDMHLPDDHGLSLLRHVRLAAPQTPIVVITSLDDDRLATDALKAGAQDYLVKGDLTVGSLTRALRHAEARHKLLADLEHARSQETERATHDNLTGLPNRILLFDRLGHVLNRCIRASTRFALVFIDLNGFKEVNDTYGHATGDEILREVARRLTASIRSSDTVARLGGDEFTVLFEEIPDRCTAETLVQGIHARFLHPIIVHGHGHRISVSAGLAVYPDNGRDAASLLGFADAAMYEKKYAAKSRML